jgi:3-oxoacyl-(acyl-carrier-protein) synthase
MVTPLGCGVETTWKRLLAGESGARKIDKFEAGDLAAKIACSIPRGDGANGTYNPDQWMEPINGWSRKSSARSTSSSFTRCAPRAKRSSIPAGNRRVTKIRSRPA